WGPPRVRTAPSRTGRRPIRRAVPAHPAPAQQYDAREPRPATPDRSPPLRPPDQYTFGRSTAAQYSNRADEQRRSLTLTDMDRMGMPRSAPPVPQVQGEMVQGRRPTTR